MSFPLCSSSSACRRESAGLVRGGFAALPAARGADAIERQPPGRARNPAAKAVAVAQPVEVAVSAQQGFLRHVFGLGAIAKNAQSHAVGELVAVGEPLFKLA